MKKIMTAALLTSVMAIGGCGQGSTAVPPSTSTTTAAPIDPCVSIEQAIDDAAYVIVLEPNPGDTVRLPLTVNGCSRTYESTFTWVVADSRGQELASGFAQGGGLAGGDSFEFDIDFDVSQAQIVHLDVRDSGGSDEGGTEPRTTLPLIAVP